MCCHGVKVTEILAVVMFPPDWLFIQICSEFLFSTLLSAGSPTSRAGAISKRDVIFA